MILDYQPHPRFRLGNEGQMVEWDFEIYNLCRDKDNIMVSRVEDTKGAETPQFRKNVGLWFEYGFLPLLILKRGKGHSWLSEWVYPKWYQKNIMWWQENIIRLNDNETAGYDLRLVCNGVISKSAPDKEG